MSIITCTLCLNSVSDKCFVSCAGEDADYSILSCPILKNDGCGHAFHQHCVESVYMPRQQEGKEVLCPNCDEAWVVSPIVVGDRVITSQGMGVLEHMDSDGMCRVVLDWHLADNAKVYSYMLSAKLERAPIVDESAIRVGQRVNSPQGTGVLKSINGEMCSVLLDWHLAQGAKVYSYLLYSLLTKSTTIGPGDRVETPQGPGIVKFVAPTGMSRVELVWRLHNDARVNSYIETKLLIRSPPLLCGDHVLTPQGLGILQEINEETKMARVCLNWQLAEGARVYSHILYDLLKPAPRLVHGDRVNTPQGPGVLEHIGADGMSSILLDSELAEGAKVFSLIQTNLVSKEQASYHIWG